MLDPGPMIRLPVRYARGRQVDDGEIKSEVQELE